MSALTVIALVFFSVLVAWFSAVFFIRMGIAVEKQRSRAVYFAQPAAQAIPVEGFVQRLPGQEPGYVEANEQPSFEETLNSQGRAVVYIRGRG